MPGRHTTLWWVVLGARCPHPGRTPAVVLAIAERMAIDIKGESVVFAFKARSEAVRPPGRTPPVVLAIAERMATSVKGESVAFAFKARSEAVRPPAGIRGAGSDRKTSRSWTSGAK